MDQEIKKERNMLKNRQSKDIKKILYQELNRVACWFAVPLAAVN